jgi:hypothetical protein
VTRTTRLLPPRVRKRPASVTSTAAARTRRAAAATGVAIGVLGALASGALAGPALQRQKAHCRKHIAGFHPLTKPRPGLPLCPRPAVAPAEPPPSANAPTAHAPSPNTPPLPSIEFATESHLKWRVGNALAYISISWPPVGTTFMLELNEPAAVAFALSQWVRGREVNHKCVAQTATNTHRPGCVRPVTKGTLQFAGHAGINTVFFAGQMSRGHKLQPGTYTVALTATNAANQRSTPRRLGFVIVR